MNLINCSDKCKFQVDGYCTLKDTNTFENSSKTQNNCMYFTPIKPKL